MVDWLSGADWFDLLGIFGVILYIGSYFGLQAGLIKGQGYLYALLNTAAAGCVLVSLAEHFNLSSAIIEVTYIAISLFGIVRFYLLTHRIDFTEEELMFLGVVGPNLSKLQARRLIDLGEWSNVDSGTRLTREGEPNTHLYFLRFGTADVSVGDHVVAQLGPASLIGEIACLNRTPASASVTVTAPARLFAIRTEALSVFLMRNAPVRHEMESRFASQISEKLLRANAILAGRN